MAQIKPLNAIHYDTTRVDLDDVTTPPYDIINPEAQERYYERSPFNVIRLDLGRTLASDTPDDNRYTRANADFTRWLQEGVLVRDDLPGLYIYRQKFTLNNQPSDVTGMICRVGLEEFGAGILPHEKTLSAPRQDRRALLEACEANFSPVFALYADKTKTVKEIFERAIAAGAPSQQTTDEAGVTHQVWTLTDGEAIAAVTKVLAAQRLLIADGHHRYETALNFAKDMAAAGVAGDFGHIMMYLVDMASETLTILPTHRVLRLNDPDIDDLLVRLGRDYEIATPMDSDPLPSQEPKTIVFDLYARGRRVRLRAERQRLIDAIPGSHAARWTRLDTAILQETVLGPHLDVAGGDPRLSFTQDPVEAQNMVDRGDASLAFIINPTSIDQIAAVAEAGEKMPQKSTYFWPKPRTGLIINRL